LHGRTKLGFSVANLTGAMDEVSSGDCFAEHIINRSGGGAVGVIMNSRYGWGAYVGSSYVMGPSEMIDTTFMHRIFYDGIYRQGQMLASAKTAWVPYADQSNQYEYMRWCLYELNLFGDPELPVWTEDPDSTRLTYNATLPTGSSSYSVTVKDRSNAAISGALVCVRTKTNGVYATGTTNSSGVATFSLSPSAAETLFIAATARNRYFNSGYALITGTATPTLAVSMTSWSPTAAGGTSSAVSVTNSATTSVIAYTVASSQTWLTVSSASGSTPGSFTMTAAANTTTSSRTATVTVTATTSGVSGSPKTISVTQAGTSSGTAEWTIMVYLNADNNLEDDGINDFLEMAAASYTSGKVNVIVQMDRSSSYNTAYGNWTTCKRFKIANGMTPEATYQLSDLGEVDMGNPTTLSTFATWAIQNYPANRYSLIMWDHGSGWYKGDNAVFKDFSNDDQSGNSIGIANGEFAGAMATIKNYLGRNLDHIGWDACLMGMWEVLDISRNYANVANVSEETESAAGWYYTTWLNNLNTTPTMSAIDMGKAIINGTSQSTLSVVDLTQIAALNTVVSTFADELMAARAAGLSSSLSTALTNTLKFSPSYFSYHIDLSDFATKVKAQVTAIPALTTACDNVISAVTNAVKLYKNSSSYANARGIAIFHNSSSSNYNTTYNSLPVAASTHWDEYLKGQTSASSSIIPGGATNTRFGRDHAPAFELAPCLPNPVRSSAILSFQLLDPAPTTLRIYNLNGQLVKTLVDGYCGTGWHDCQWDLNDNTGNRVSAGTYLFKLESGALHDMKRLVVVK
jgi:hypothetical protein